MAIEHYVHAVILEELGYGAHLVVADGRVAAREAGLVEHNDLPHLMTRVQIVDYPIFQDGRVRRKRKIGRGGRRPVRQQIVEHVRIRVEEHEMGIAVIERIVRHVVDLAFRTLSAVDRSAGAQRFYCSR